MAETNEAVRRFLDGEKGAFGSIVKCWERKVYSLAWRMLGNHEDAQDVVQETFLSVYKAIGGLRDPGSFSTWLYRITLNHCRVRRKARAAELFLNDRIFDQTVGDEGLPGGISEPHRGVEALETLDIVRKALAGLREDHRTAIILKEYLGLSLEELANVMDCPLSTAKSRLYHGLRSVQRNLKRMGIKVGES
jgi:RNA polymerase sigma-70 factor (ECF subfamily)